MSIKKGEVEVRQRGGTLSSKWTKLYCVLNKTGVSYYNSVAEYKAKTPIETITLPHISDVHCIKNTGQEGFMFEIKSSSGQIKTQHLCPTDDDRQKWVYAVMKTKSEPQSMTESSEEEEKKKKGGKAKVKPEKEADPEKKAKKPEEQKQKKKEESPITESAGKKAGVKSPRNKSDKAGDKPEKTDQKPEEKRTDKSRDKAEKAEKPEKQEKISEKSKGKEEPKEEPEADYSNSGTMVIVRPNPKKDDKKEANGTASSNLLAALNSIGGSSGKSSNIEPTAAAEDYANATGTMIVSKTMKKPDPKEEREIFREELNTFSTEELQKWHDTKLEKNFKKEYDRILRKWKEEKSSVLYAMRKREIDAIEEKYEKLQLNLENELQEKRVREKITN